MSSEFDDLEALLGEAKAAERDAREVKAARERAKRGGLTPAQREEDEARLREWEARHEWKDVANVAQWERHRCACGRQQTIFRQLMRKQVHRHLRDSVRYVQVEAQVASLPNELLVQKWNTPMCTSCAPRAGFDFETMPVKEYVA
jgi:hypothetical protein